MTEIPITKAQRVKRIQSYISRMPSLSTTFTRVLEICDSPTTSPDDLKRVISLDPVLTGQVLKLINSAYCSVPNRVTSLTRAVILLGLNTVKALALSAAVLRGMGCRGSSNVLSMDDFWTHSLCVGVTAKCLATIKGVPPGEREVYFVAGLLHDIGKIPLSDCFREEYMRVLESAARLQCSLQEAENTILGIDHSAVGRMIAGHWRLDETMTDALCCHHNIDAIKGADSQLIMVVALANDYGNTRKIGSSGDFFPESPMADSLLELAGVSRSALADISEIVINEIEKARVFLQIVGKG